MQSKTYRTQERVSLSLLKGSPLFVLTWWVFTHAGVPHLVMLLFTCVFIACYVPLEIWHRSCGRIEVSDTHIAGPPGSMKLVNQFRFRIEIPREDIDVARTSRQGKLTAFCGGVTIWATNGDCIELDRNFLGDQQVREILDELGLASVIDL